MNYKSIVNWFKLLTVALTFTNKFLLTYLL